VNDFDRIVLVAFDADVHAVLLAEANENDPND